MKNFTQWAKDQNLDISLPKQDETAKRGGIASWAYPELYKSGQYPNLYFTPSAADAPIKLKKSK